MGWGAKHFVVPNLKTETRPGNVHGYPEDGPSLGMRNVEEKSCWKRSFMNEGGGLAQ